MRRKKEKITDRAVGSSQLLITAGGQVCKVRLLVTAVSKLISPSFKHSRSRTYKQLGFFFFSSFSECLVNCYSLVSLVTKKRQVQAKPLLFLLQPTGRTEQKEAVYFSSQMHTRISRPVVPWNRGRTGSISLILYKYERSHQSSPIAFLSTKEKQDKKYSIKTAGHSQ